MSLVITNGNRISTIPTPTSVSNSSSNQRKNKNGFDLNMPIIGRIKDARVGCGGCGGGGV
jgi:hypothetical protein